MTVARAEIAWLDACCWRCGSEDVLPDGQGPLLSGPCRAELLDDPAGDPMRVSRRAYRESHALERCWRCMAEAVDPEGEVGLCGS